MNFQELMSRATQNCNSTMKQRKKAGHLHKDNASQVSSSAVQAFLARKQQEQKKRQADDEAARRARIEARIEQNLKQKRGTKKEKPSSEPSLNNQTRNDEQERPEKQRREEKSKAEQESCFSTFVADKPRKESNTRQQKQQKQKEGIVNSACSAKKKSKSHPPNFKELLEMAKKNSLQRNEHSKTNGISKIDTKAINDKLKEKPKKAVQQRQDDFKKSKSKPLSKTTTTTLKRDRELKPQPKTNTTNYSKALVHNKPPMKRPNPNTMSTSWQQRSIHKNKRQYNSYYEKEEEDDMDGFIDDEDLDSGGDVSAHIREIFGYDRRRFDDDDIDDSAMESSYTQIEREEQRSSKIAKLEDEIAFLKEQAELKREKQRLMKNKKRTRK